MRQYHLYLYSRARAADHCVPLLIFGVVSVVMQCSDLQFSPTGFTVLEQQRSSWLSREIGLPSCKMVQSDNQRNKPMVSPYVPGH